MHDNLSEPVLSCSSGNVVPASVIAELLTVPSSNFHSFALLVSQSLADAEHIPENKAILEIVRC